MPVRRATVTPIQIGGGNRARTAVVAPPRVSRGGSGLSEAAKALATFATILEEDAQDRDRIRAVEVEEQLKRDIDERMADLNPLDDDYLEASKASLEEAQASAIEGANLTTTAIQSLLARRVEALTEGSLTLAAVSRRGALEDRATVLTGEVSDAALAKIRQDPDGSSSYVAEFMGAWDQLQTAVPPQKREAFVKAFNDNAILAKTEGLALAGRYEEARAFVDAFQGELPPATYRAAKKLIRSVEDIEHTDRLTDTARMAADISIRIGDATTQKELNDIRSNIELLDAVDFWKGREQKRSSLIAGVSAAKVRVTAGQVFDVFTDLVDTDSHSGLASIRTRIEGMKEAGTFKGREATFARLIAAIESKKNKLSAMADIEAEDISADEKARRRADLNIKVIDADTQAELDAIRVEIEELDRGGEFSGKSNQGYRATLIGKVEAKINALIAGNKANQDAIQDFTNNVLGSQTDADRVWGAISSRLDEEDLDEGQREEAELQLGVEFMRQSGYAPGPFNALIKNAGSSTDPEVVARAAVMLGRIHEQVPEVKMPSSPRVQIAAALMELQGKTPEDAAALAIAKIPDKATLEFRREQFDLDFPELDAQAFLSDAGVISSSFLGFGDDAVVPPSVARDFERTLRLRYEMIGDAEVATDAALRDFSIFFGETSVGGRSAPEVSRFPIEKHLPPALLSGLRTNSEPAEVATKMVNEYVRALMLEAGIEPKAGPEALGDRDFNLVADKLTRLAWDRGEPLSWELRVMDTGGSMQPIRTPPGSREPTVRVVAPTLEELAITPTYQDIISREKGKGARRPGLPWRPFSAAEQAQIIRELTSAASTVERAAVMARHEEERQRRLEEKRTQDALAGKGS